jgi:DNA-binding transcriptional MocR family regulator
MAPEKSAELLARERLATLGVSLRSEWDVLSFLYRHDTSLTSAAQIAHLLGHDKAAVHAALDRLESMRLIERSRGSQGVRLYRSSVPADPRIARARSLWVSISHQIVRAHHPRFPTDVTFRSLGPQLWRMAPKSLVALPYGLSFSSPANPATNAGVQAPRNWLSQRGLQTLPYRVPVFPQNDERTTQDRSENNLR